MNFTISRSPIKSPKTLNKSSFLVASKFLEISDQTDPLTAIASGKIMAKAWAISLHKNNQSAACFTFIYRVIESYWNGIHKSDLRALPDTFHNIRMVKLDNTVLSVAKVIGLAASKLDVIDASFHLGNLYTSVLPEAIRSSHGIFYTPPALTKRLIEVSENAGINWASAKIVDPACGGGAFLAPVVLKMVEALNGKSPKQIIRHVEQHLKGFEIDPFGAWLSQVFLEIALKSVLDKANVRINKIVHVCDSLELNLEKFESQFDLVIGNPPYGKISLSNSMREKFADGLYGHANYYGLFTQLALQLVRENGVVGFLTPTSFLSGEYFKKLRSLIRATCQPVEIDFITVRKDVFDGVLQETMLTAYKKSSVTSKGPYINQITTLENNKLRVQGIGKFKLPEESSMPWILPRASNQAHLVEELNSMTHDLKSWGYQISTGPFVWNRHKEQLSDTKVKSSYPIIWSEAVTQAGTFILKAEKRNHKSFFKFKEGDDFLVVQKECILLQRTTAKEQNKRLIAALLPSEVIRKYKGVVIENHLNMIIPISKNPLVLPEVLSVFLNSKAVNDSFRNISGSVAVSAYELNSLPLPSPENLTRLTNLVFKKAKDAAIEEECFRIYRLA